MENKKYTKIASKSFLEIKYAIIQDKAVFKVK